MKNNGVTQGYVTLLLFHYLHIFYSIINFYAFLHSIKITKVYL
ncbi:hypothetical protein SAMN05518684_106166 [Salipaludibacillus aurantiacus]|uniref:Uncharacterized protein n=1 Tax=Salipaludibacillus aurantiacus TaxID=1601833 RepID=A0A1H9TYB1_9BACI|nr:hypothetical protein SAMN05518684_106166 [Salipaludibacillus aurantiacus]